MTDNSHPHQEIISTTEKDSKHLEKEGGQEKKKMKNDIEWIHSLKLIQLLEQWCIF